MMRKLTVLAAGAVVAGCVGVGPGDFAYDAEAPFTIEPRPTVSGQPYDDYDEESAVAWGARGGVILFVGAQTAIDPRVTVGGYARLLEDEAKRIEIGAEFTPDIANISRGNLYVSFSGDYVGFLSDLLFWKVGGGGIFEMRGDVNQFFGLFEGGAGLWIEVGEEGAAAVVNLLLQVPLGSDLNVNAMMAITGGYEF
jgi:hypothetical protein